ncbi:MAG TPA: SDR family oxidoreductase [Bacteroidia bacterium]|nr:SDR family oxidoreductase [Bacteroidia bacterium]
MKKNYIIAGASSSMAKTLTVQLKEQGHTVIGISTKTEVEGYDEVYTIPNYHESTYPELEIPINGLIYFPGSINLKPFARLSSEDFINDFNINALGAVKFIQAYLKNMKLAGTSSVVFVSSVAASCGMPYHTSIAMAKAAVEGLTISLAAELAPSVRVNAVAPSLTNTTLSEKFLNTPEKMEAAQKRNPLKQIGKPEDISNAIEFLISDKSGWVTGQIISVDGGMNNLKL